MKDTLYLILINLNEDNLIDSDLSIMKKNNENKSGTIKNLP